MSLEVGSTVNVVTVVSPTETETPLVRSSWPGRSDAGAAVGPSAHAAARSVSATVERAVNVRVSFRMRR